jgi:hypothetical protein
MRGLAPLIDPFNSCRAQRGQRCAHAGRTKKSPCLAHARQGLIEAALQEKDASQSLGDKANAAVVS